MKEPDLEIPKGLFRTSNSLPRSDRYVVYRMLHRKVSFTHTETKAKVSGYIDEVYRDIFAGELVLTINGKAFKFKEPTLVRENVREFIFVYGDVGRGKQDIGDERLFKEMKQEQFRETVSDTIKRLDPRRLYEIRFTVGERKQARRKPFLMRGISPNVADSVDKIS